MEFRIFNENIGLAPSQKLPNSGDIPTPAPGEDVSVESRPSTEVVISDLQVNASKSVSLKHDARSKSGNATIVDNPPQSDRETKALQTLNQAIKGLVDLGLEPRFIQNQFRQAISSLTKSIEDNRFLAYGFVRVCALGLSAWSCVDGICRHSR